MTLIVILAAAAAIWWWHHHRPKTGPGASAAARARALRTPLVRLADTLGIPTAAGALARRSHAGSVGEKRTAKRVAPLAAEGWSIFHDLAIPGRNENVDHLLISPGDSAPRHGNATAGAVFLPDTKLWSAQQPITIREGRLFYGEEDVTDRLKGLHRETAAVSKRLGVPVTPLVVMDGPALIGPRGRCATHLDFHGVRIIPAHRLVDYLRTQARTPGHRPTADLIAAVHRELPPYTRHHRHP